MSLEDIREYFSRHFLGRVKVHHSETAIPAPDVLALRRRVQTHPIRARMRVLSPSLLSLHGLECSNKGFRFATDLVQVKGARIQRYAPDELGGARAPLMRETSRPRNGLKRILMFPQERANRLQWQTYRPKDAARLVKQLGLMDACFRALPVYTLYCNMDPSAARMAWETMGRHLPE